MVPVKMKPGSGHNNVPVEVALKKKEESKHSSKQMHNYLAPVDAYWATMFGLFWILCQNAGFNVKVPFIHFSRHQKHISYIIACIFSIHLLCDMPFLRNMYLDKIHQSLSTLKCISKSDFGNAWCKNKHKQTCRQREAWDLLNLIWARDFYSNVVPGRVLLLWLRICSMPSECALSSLLELASPATGTLKALNVNVIPVQVIKFGAAGQNANYGKRM